MDSSVQHSFPALLMVSGGSDSEAMLEMAVAGELPGAWEGACFHVLHVNHMLRGAAADADAAFVERRCAELGAPFALRCADVPALACESGVGFEAAARELRYRLAEEQLDALCAECGCVPERGRILTAHTLDDRVETFFMRALVGTGPGGLGSIPAVRGRIVRPLLSQTREGLRSWLRARHPSQPDVELWREDATNDDGSNFRSQVRHRLMPVARELRPGFEQSLAQTMDLIAEEDAVRDAQAVRVVALNFVTKENGAAHMPVSAFNGLDRPMCRRVVRHFLLALAPAARLEAAQIERVVEHLGVAGYATDVSGALRVRIEGGVLSARLVQS